RATRRFARRQESWFRRDPRITWLTAGAGDLARGAGDLAGGAGDSAADLAQRALGVLAESGLIG
ncbi:MAG: hypothetical protein ABJB47_07080, partial [Actinomycetota bacterium]